MKVGTRREVDYRGMGNGLAVECRKGSIAIAGDKQLG